eukprot:SAG25_NODE_3669_length_1006_cov_3.315325_1_plen_185_part_10
MTSRHAASVCPCPRYTYGGKKCGEKVLTAPLYRTPQLPAQGAAHRRNLGCCCISRHHAEVAENPRKPRGTREFCVARTCRQPVHLVIAGGGRVLTSPQHVLPPILLQRAAPRSLAEGVSSPLRASALSPERSGYAIGPLCLALVGGHNPGLRTGGEGGATASGASHRSPGGGRRRRHAPIVQLKN